MMQSPCTVIDLSAIERADGLYIPGFVQGSQEPLSPTRDLRVRSVCAILNQVDNHFNLCTRRKWRASQDDAALFLHDGSSFVRVHGAAHCRPRNAPSIVLSRRVKG